MDPITLATVAVGMLVTFITKAGEQLADRAGERVGQATADVTGRLYTRIKERLSRDQYDAQLLKGVENSPDSPARRKNLETGLAELLERDPAFASEVEELVNEAKASGQVAVSARDAGIVTGGDVDVRAGRDVVGRDQIHYAPHPPQS